MTDAPRPSDSGKEVRDYGNLPHILSAFAEELFRETDHSRDEVFEMVAMKHAQTLRFHPRWDEYSDKRLRKIVTRAQRAAGQADGVETARALNHITRTMKPAGEPQPEAIPGQARALQILRANQAAKRQLAEEDALANPLPPVDVGTLAEMRLRDDATAFRFKDLLCEGGRMNLIAPAKTGKTTLAVNITHSLVTGEPLLGRFETTPITGTVLVMNYEVTGATFAGWLSSRGFSDEEAERVLIMNLRGAENPFASDRGRADLVRFMREHGVEVLIVDNFGRAFQGEQNSNSEVSDWLGMLDRVATDGGVQELILITHAGHLAAGGTTRSRGASVLTDWPDTLATLSLDGDLDGNRYFEAFGRDVSIERARLDFDPESRRLTYTGETKRSATKARKTGELSEPILDIVKATPGIGSGAIKTDLRHRHPDLRYQDGDVIAAVKSLVESGSLLRFKDGPAQHHYLPDSVPAKYRDLLEDPSTPNRKKKNS